MADCHDEIGDETTDFSQRFRDDIDIEDDVTVESLCIEDTIKTYYTEDTPLRMLSAASSITDLSELSAQTNNNNCNGYRPKPMPRTQKPSVPPKPPPRYESLENKNPHQSPPVPLPRTKPKVPPKPANLAFRIPAKQPTVPIVENDIIETPLMFSRCSSVESLSSVDLKFSSTLVNEDHLSAENGIDNSSVISEFSRLTSQVVSPTDIPESAIKSVSSTPCDSSDDDDPTENGEDDELLEQCISAAMNNSHKLQNGRTPQKVRNNSTVEDTPEKQERHKDDDQNDSKTDLDEESFSSSNSDDEEEDQADIGGDQNDDDIMRCIAAGMPSKQNDSRVKI